MKFSPKKGKNIGDTKDINKKKRKPVLSLLLKHGDMLVMHEERIQKLYLVRACNSFFFFLGGRIFFFVNYQEFKLDLSYIL